MAGPDGYDVKFWPEPQGTETSERDISEDTRQTLADYLKSITSGDAPNVAAPNPYPMSNTMVEVPMTTDAGRPAPFTTGGPDGTGQAKFMDDVNDDARATLAQYSNSGKFDSVAPTGEPLSSYMDKNSQTDGNTLLSSVVGQDLDTHGTSVRPDPPGAPTVQKKISEVLKTNRFSNSTDSPYIQAGTYSNTSIPEQGEFGVYKDIDSSKDIDDLFKIGLSMIFQATGHSDNNPTSAASRIEAITPSGVQLLVNKVGVDKMSAREAYRAPDVTRLTDSDLLVDANGDSINEQKSYGQLNSHLEPFAGFYPAGMVALALTSMVATIGAAAVFSILISAIRGATSGGGSGAGGGVETVNSPSALRLGSRYYMSAGWKLLNMMGIPRTRFNFEKCIVRGLLAFYGIPIGSVPGSPTTIPGLAAAAAIPPPLPGSDWLEAAENLYSAGGFYTGILRNALRDAFELPEISAEWAAAAAGGIPAQGIFYVIGEITRSSTFRFLMVMAQIGNQRLIAKQRTFGTTARINNIPDNPATKIAKSRVNPSTAGGSKDRLVWRHSNNQSRYLIPTSFQIAALQFDEEGSASAAYAGSYGWLKKKMVFNSFTHAYEDVGKPELSTIAAMTGVRISKEYVHFIENQLELEYMPFYFHDLRTNEVIAFNAFIDSIKDSFSVDYSSTNSYGRIDPVMIYNKTTRSISVNFVLAATSKKDFDAMWFDINKLTTLIYPQWSRGKPVKAPGGEKFIMPFSQIPTASPMIRLRLGDAIRGNFSKFSLARLFGAGIFAEEDADYNIGVVGSPESWQCDGNDFSSHDDAVDYQTTAVADATDLRETDPLGDPESDYGFQVGQTAFLIPAPAGGHYCVDVPDGPPDTHTTTSVFPMRNTEPGQVIIMSRQADIGGDPYAINYVIHWTEIGKVVDPYGPDHTHEMTVYHSDLTIDMSDIDFPITHTESTTMPTSAAFYDNNNNAIVRSFRSTMGRGLAGFIDSFDIDYADSTWETQLGSRAPQMVKISIGFKPIHDIPPGIDSEGFNRAPIYNVGRTMNAISGDPWGNRTLDPTDPMVIDYLAARAAINAPAGEEVDPGGWPPPPGSP